MFKAKFYASLRVDEGVPLQTFDLEILRSTEDDDYIRHIKVSDNVGCLIIGKHDTRIVSNGHLTKGCEVDHSSFPGFVFAWEEDSADSFWMARVNPLNSPPMFGGEYHRYLALKFNNCSPSVVVSEYHTWRKNVDPLGEICTWFDFIQYKAWGEKPLIEKFSECEDAMFSRLNKIALYSKRDFTMKSTRDTKDRTVNLQHQIQKLINLRGLTGGATGVLKKHLDKYANIGDSLSFYSLLDLEQLNCLGW